VDAMCGFREREWSGCVGHEWDLIMHWASLSSFMGEAAADPSGKNQAGHMMAHRGASGAVSIAGQGRSALGTPNCARWGRDD
jgi:hypothetical protein